MKRNNDIRQYAKEHNVYLWQIAQVMGGCNDGNFSRKLRVELPTEQKAEIRATIDELAENNNKTEGN